MSTPIHPVAHPEPIHAAAPTKPVAPTHDVLPAGTPGADPFDFVKADRINVKDGSLFIDGYLVLHPHELAPENEEKLKKKLELTYSVNNPSFYESKDRLAIALNLGQLIPVSLETDYSDLHNRIAKYNAQVDSGVDADLLRLNNDKQHPFAAIVRDTIAKPAKDPIGIETLKSGLSIYLLMREKLTNMGYRNGLASYVSKSQTPDQVLTDLGDKIGVKPEKVWAAALEGGVDGVGKLLQLDPAYVKDVKAFVDFDATQEFSLNAIEHWHQGRHILGIPAPIPQKIATGMAARIDKTIVNARERVHHFYEVPEPIKHEEAMVAQAMNVLEPIQRALMFKLGYEVCYTPDNLADGIAFYPGVYGLHRKAANDLHNARGTYRVYFSGHGDMKAAWRTLAHESAHLLNPEQFGAEEVAQIDALATSDKERFRKFNDFMDKHFVDFDRLVRGYQTVAPQDQAAYLAKAKAWSEKEGGIDVSAAIPYLHNAQDFLFMVKHAYDTLEVEGSRYAKSGYNSPHERFREVISRFAELKQVEYEAQPQLLQIVAPGLNQIWETHYIPHLRRVYQSLVKDGIAPKITQPLRDAAPSESPVKILDASASPILVNDAEESPKAEVRPNPEPVQPIPGAPTPTHEPTGTMPAPVVTAPTQATPEMASATAAMPATAEAPMSPVSVEPPEVTPPTPPTEPVATTPTAPTPEPKPLAPVITMPSPPVAPIMAVAASSVPDVNVSPNGAMYAGPVSANSQVNAALDALGAMGINAR